MDECVDSSISEMFSIYNKFGLTRLYFILFLKKPQLCYISKPQSRIFNSVKQRSTVLTEHTLFHGCQQATSTDDLSRTSGPNRDWP